VNPEQHDALLMTLMDLLPDAEKKFKDFMKDRESPKVKK
jgi:hypothetical protein